MPGTVRRDPDSRQPVDQHMEPLTDLEQQVLDWETEHQHWVRAGARIAAIRERFGWSETRHAQVLNALLDRPAAEAHAPQLVHRLRRLREERVRQRTAWWQAGREPGASPGRE